MKNVKTSSSQVSRSTLGALSALFLLAACSTTVVTRPEQYLELGNHAMEEEDWPFAVQQYERLLEEFPFSDQVEEAQRKIALAYFRDGRYPEAIASFQDFQRMYPTSDSVPFTEYHIGLAYLEQMGDADRDQRASENAHAHFQAVIDRYPDHPLAQSAAEELHECRVALAEHELHVARFYLHWENPNAAESRLRYLVETYPDTDVTAEALVEFGDHFRARGDLARSAMAYAGVVRSFPTSTFTGEATRRLSALESEDVPVPNDPLAALLETLGRPRAEPSA